LYELVTADSASVALLEAAGSTVCSLQII